MLMPQELLINLVEMLRKGLTYARILANGTR